MANPCEVPWCAAIAERGRYCLIHANRPAMFNEKQAAWLQRLRAEDKAAKEAAAKKEPEEASGQS
jgi:hypothetical protein